MITGQVAAPVAAMLLGFASSEQRVPAAVPLALAAGPACLALFVWLRSTVAGAPRPAAVLPGIDLVLAALLLLQAFLPRDVSTEPSAWHYFHVGDIDERIGSLPNAALSYGEAIQRDPREPIFLLRQARLLKLLLALEPADRVLRRLEALDDVSPHIRREAAIERAQIDGLMRFAATRDAQKPASHSN
jgi:hypothetical protein